MSFQGNYTLLYLDSAFQGKEYPIVVDQELEKQVSNRTLVDVGVEKLDVFLLDVIVMIKFY
jgi:hypothetical protein